jgi:hypothetical protein
MRIQLLTALATIGLVGCVGGIESGGGEPRPEDGDDGNDNGDNPTGTDLTAAKQLFDTNVYSIVNAKCTGGACHSETAAGATLTRFVATDAARGWQVATNYQALVGNYVPASAPILTYLANGHKSQTFTADEKTKIEGWLNKELELRAGQTTPTPPGQETLAQASQRVLAEFNGCMTQDDMQQTNFASAWANLGSGEGACQQCHTTGGEGFWANANTAQTYTVLSTRQYYFLQYLTVDLTQGAAAAKVKVNDTSFLGVYNGQDPHREHPRFNMPNNNGMTALKALEARVAAKKAAGTCGAPKPFTM